MEVAVHSYILSYFTHLRHQQYINAIFTTELITIV